MCKIHLVTFVSFTRFQQNTNKIIPIIFKKCDLPSQFALYHKLPYLPETKVFNFWDKLLVKTFWLQNVTPEMKKYTFPIENKEVMPMALAII